MPDFEHFLLTVVYDMPSLIFVTDQKDGAIVYANPYMKATLGADCIGRRFCEQFPGAGENRYFLSFTQKEALAEDRDRSQPPRQSEYFDDEAENWYHVLQRPIQWIDGTPKIAFVLNEINTIKRLQKNLADAHATLAYNHREVERLARTDPLTGLHNRHHLNEIIGHEYQRFVRYHRPFSLVLADCDQFKSVNDTYGHQVGDAILVAFSHLLQSHARAADVVGRWGGEEFLIVLPETGLADAARLAERLRAAIAAHVFPVVGHKTASFGVSEISVEEGSDDLMRRVDQALYRAKDKGRNRVEVSSGQCAS